jgi:hypothetical protein
MSGETYAATPIKADVVPPGVPTVESAGPSLHPRLLGSNDRQTTRFGSNDARNYTRKRTGF